MFFHYSYSTNQHKPVWKVTYAEKSTSRVSSVEERMEWFVRTWPVDVQATTCHFPTWFQPLRVRCVSSVSLKQAPKAQYAIKAPDHPPLSWGLGSWVVKTGSCINQNLRGGNVWTERKSSTCCNMMKCAFTTADHRGVEGKSSKNHFSIALSKFNLAGSAGM